MSNITKRIGKIKSVSFGLGGYQDAMVGLVVEVTMENRTLKDWRILTEVL